MLNITRNWHFQYQAEGGHTSSLPQPLPQAHPGHFHQADNEHKASALGALAPDAGAPPFLLTDYRLPSPSLFSHRRALAGTSGTCVALQMPVSVPSTFVLSLAFMALYQRQAHQEK